jgi:hypothetical protein
MQKLGTLSWIVMGPYDHDSATLYKALLGLRLSCGCYKRFTGKAQTHGNKFVQTCQQDFRKETMPLKGPGLSNNI